MKQNTTSQAMHLLTFQASEQRAAVLRPDIPPEQCLPTPQAQFHSAPGFLMRGVCDAQVYIGPRG